MPNAERLTAQLLELLGTQDFIRLCETFGGIRLYASLTRSELIDAIGDEAAGKLARRFGGAPFRVPLARPVRARHYREIGLSNAQIAIRLGITETGVDKLFHRMPGKPVKGSKDPRQGELFP